MYIYHQILCGIMKIITDVSIESISDKKKAFRIRNVYRSITLSNESLDLLEAVKNKYFVSYSQILEYLIDNRLENLLEIRGEEGGYLLEYKNKKIADIARLNRRTIRMTEHSFKVLKRVKARTNISISEITDQLIKCIDLPNE